MARRTTEAASDKPRSLMVRLDADVTVQQGHMGCKCRSTPGVGACRRRLGCHWWGAGICFWGVVGDMPGWQKGGYRVTQRGGLRFSR
jgi:hypothetical protein